MWTNHAVWTGGLGSTDNTNWAPDWTVVASQSGISLLQSPSPEGMSFIVVINQGQPNEKRLFPTDKNPSASEMNRGLDPNEAFEQFQNFSLNMEELLVVQQVQTQVNQTHLKNWTQGLWQ